MTNTTTSRGRRFLRRYIAGDCGGECLFRENGIRRPRLVGIAISMAAATGGFLTRQPTRERAEAIADAIRAKITRRGYGLVIRTDTATETFGLYLVYLDRADASATQ